jgi:hypothetical protein
LGDLNQGLRTVPAIRLAQVKKWNKVAVLSSAQLSATPVGSRLGVAQTANRRSVDAGGSHVASIAELPSGAHPQIVGVFSQLARWIALGAKAGLVIGQAALGGTGVALLQAAARGLEHTVFGLHAQIDLGRQRPARNRRL